RQLLGLLFLASRTKDSGIRPFVRASSANQGAPDGIGVFVLPEDADLRKVAAGGAMALLLPRVVRPGTSRDACHVGQLHQDAGKKLDERIVGGLAVAVPAKELLEIQRRGGEPGEGGRPFSSNEIQEPRKSHEGRPDLRIRRERQLIPDLFLKAPDLSVE